MKAHYFLLSATAGLISFATIAGATMIESFANVQGSSIQFNGSASSFQFNSSTIAGPNFGSQWVITGQSGGTGSSIGLLGLFGGGPFTYGPITTQVAGPNTLETANVTGPLGGLIIGSGSGNLIGTIAWGQIATINSAGGINADLQVNVSNLSYAGSNPDLVALAANNLATLVISFQFSTVLTLADLSAGQGPYQTSYSGTISAPDHANTAYLLLAGLFALGCFQYHLSTTNRPALRRQKN